MAGLLYDRDLHSVDIPITANEDVLSGQLRTEDGLDEIRALRDEGFVEIVPVAESNLFVELRRELNRGEAAALHVRD